MLHEVTAAPETVGTTGGMAAPRVKTKVDGM